MIALAVTFAVLLADPSRPRLPAAVRLLLAALAFLAAGAVAVAVVALGLHYFTDTIGGAATGTAVVLLAALIIDSVAGWRQRAHRRGNRAKSGAEAPTTGAPLAPYLSRDACRRRQAPATWLTMLVNSHGRVWAAGTMRGASTRRCLDHSSPAVSSRDLRETRRQACS